MLFLSVPVVVMELNVLAKVTDAMIRRMSVSVESVEKNLEDCGKSG